MKICVDCEADMEGRRAVPVREDRIIRGIRAIKRAFNVAQNNELYVCEGCMKKHIERRKSFEKSMLFASVLAGILLVLVIVVPIISGRFEAWILTSGFILAGLLLVFPLMKYTPMVEGAAQMPAPAPLPAPQPPAPAMGAQAAKEGPAKPKRAQKEKKKR